MLDKNNFLIKSFGDFSLYLDKNDPGISAVLLKPKYFRKWHREPVFMDIMEAEVHRGDVVFEGLGGPAPATDITWFDNRAETRAPGHMVSCNGADWRQVGRRLV
mgnify:CR=1 FL=1